MADYKNKTDEDLVFEVGRSRSKEGAPVEMMRRLKNSIEKLDKNSQKYARVLALLTMVVIVIAFWQLVITIAAPEGLLGLASLAVMGIFLIWICNKASNLCG